MKTSSLLTTAAGLVTTLFILALNIPGSTKLAPTALVDMPTAHEIISLAERAVAEAKTAGTSSLVEGRGMVLDCSPTVDEIEGSTIPTQSLVLCDCEKVLNVLTLWPLALTLTRRPRLRSGTSELVSLRRKMRGD
jgi:hypothetical protein